MSQFIKSAVLIKSENRFLLVQENNIRVRGLWNLIQGKVEAGETIEESVIREAREETGLNIKLEKPLGVLKNTFPDIKELHVYLGSIIDGEMKFPTNEIIDVQFFTFEDIERIKDKLVGNWVYDIILQNK